MSAMDTERLARGWSLIAEGAMEISLAYSAIESSAPVRADEPVARTGFAGTEGVVGPPPPSSVPVQEQHIEQHLGSCPDHGVAWTVKAGGISRDGKPFNSFWRCDQRAGDGWCKRKPVKAWTDSHPLAAAA